MATTLTQNPDYESQSLDSLRLSTPQSPIGLAPDRVHLIGSQKAQSALVRTTITATDHKEIPVASKSDTKIGHT